MARYILPLIIVVALAIYFFNQSGDDPAEFEKIFNQVLEAGKQKNLEGITDHFSLQYKDEHGISYPILKNLIKRSFEKYDAFDGKFTVASTSVSENEQGEKLALVNMDLNITGTKSGIPYDLIGADDSPENITITLQKSTLGKWKIIEIEGLRGIDDNY